MDRRQQRVPSPAVQILSSVDGIKIVRKALLESIIQVEFHGAPLRVAEHHQHGQEGQLHYGDKEEEEKGGPFWSLGLARVPVPSVSEERGLPSSLAVCTGAQTGQRHARFCKQSRGGGYLPWWVDIVAEQGACSPLRRWVPGSKLDMGIT